MPKQRRGRRLPVRLRESATSAGPVELRETPRPGAVSSMGNGRMFVQLINEGWGSSAGYPASVLAEAARKRIFARSTPIYVNHPSATEEDDRPERDVLMMAGKLVEDARWDPEKKALVAEAQIYRHWRHIFCDPEFAEDVALSIRADGLAETADFEGRRGPVVREITRAASVDFVTKAGRGGKVLALLESARANLREASVEETRTALTAAIRATYGTGDGRYAWVRDFDPDKGLVWFDTDHDGEQATWEMPYFGTGAAVELATGERTRVVAETVYRPWVAHPATTTEPAGTFAASSFAESRAEAEHLAAQQPPADPAPATTDPDGAPPADNQSEEDPDMSGAPAGTNTPAALTEADRDRLTAERETALREAADAKRELARYRAVEQAGPIVDQALAESGLPSAAVARVRAGVLARVPLTEAGVLDEAGLRSLAEAETTAEKAYVAQLAESAGAGRVSGFGATSAPAAQAAPAGWGAPEPEPNAALVESYRRRGLSESAALAAARGRAV